MKNVAVSLMAILFAACSGNKSPHSLQQEKEDLECAKGLAGIWLDDETESPLMRVEGDTIYYADVQSTPIAFKIIRDTLYTYGNDTTYYKIDKQGEHIFWFHSITDDVIKLHKSEDLNDSIYFVREEVVIPTYTEVTKRDSVVTYNGARYRAYVYINPSKMKVIKTTYSEDGISMDNVYYDNVMHICVYEGRKVCLPAMLPNRCLTKYFLSIFWSNQSCQIQSFESKPERFSLSSCPGHSGNFHI